MCKTLVIVDVQKDFDDPSGSLYVKGGEEVIENIQDLILTDLSINQVIFTVDWHTSEDHSFEKNGGTWPVHCLQFSEGASLPNQLLQAVQARGFKSIDGAYYENGDAEVDKHFISNTYDIFLKGDIPGEEEYGAFTNYEGMDNDEDLVMMSGVGQESSAYLNMKSDVIVCGLAGDYCVLETAKNILTILDEQPGETGKLMMFMPGIKSIDGGTKLGEWMTEEGIEEYNINK